MEKISKYINRVLTALSVLLNVLLGGDNNQTFSARNWHWKKNNKPHIVWLIDWILSDDHCMECWVYWKVRKKWK